MKFTVVFIAALSVSASLAIKVKKEDEAKDKREAAIGYPSIASHYQGSSLGHGDASSISVGAGYSVGAAKPSYSLGGHGGEGGLQLSSESLPASGHATIQLAPITLQPNHGLASSDLSQLMSQLSHGLNSGAITLQNGELYQSSAQGEHGGQGGQELSLPQFSYGAPKLQQYAAEQPSVPSYAAGTKGLGSYSTGPVLFSPSDSHNNAQQVTYGAPSSGHSFGGSSGSGHFNAPASGHSFGYVPSGGHSFGGLSTSPISSGGHSFGEGSGHSLPPITLGEAVHSFGGLKGFSGGYGAPSKTSFKPSAFLGASSAQGDSNHGLSGLSGLSGSYGAPSFGSFGGSHGGLSLGSGGHGASLGSHGASLGGHAGSLGGSFGGFGGGSSKFIAPSYLPPKGEGFGSSLESVAAFASEGHVSPPATTYGHPSGSYGLPSNSAHAASSSSPQYYVPSKSSYPGFGGSSSFKSPYSGHSLSSFSSGPKHSFGGHGGHSHRYGHPKDIQGAHSETSYNTIKYSEELKPRGH